jgi:hypothetical protein
MGNYRWVQIDTGNGKSRRSSDFSAGFPKASSLDDNIQLYVRLYNIYYIPEIPENKLGNVGK